MKLPDHSPARVAEQDKWGIHAAIHRDIACAITIQSEDYSTAAANLWLYIVGHLGVHGKLPSDLDDAYDKTVPFGDNESMPATADGTGSKTTLQASGGPASIRRSGPRRRT